MQPNAPCASQENVAMMADYIGLDKFKAVYIVDLCHSLCEVAKKKVKAKGWKNVFVVEGDACTFQPPAGKASLTTFSYSLSSEWPGGGGA
jgi:betaine lipid synthase